MPVPGGIEVTAATKAPFYICQDGYGRFRRYLLHHLIGNQPPIPATRVGEGFIFHKITQPATATLFARLKRNFCETAVCLINPDVGGIKIGLVKRWLNTNALSYVGSVRRKIFLHDGMPDTSCYWARGSLLILHCQD